MRTHDALDKNDLSEYEFSGHHVGGLYTIILLQLAICFVLTSCDTFRDSTKYLKLRPTY